MAKSISMPMSAPVRGAAALVAMLAYMVGFACWGGLWWVSYVDPVRFPMTSNQSFLALVAGGLILAFARDQTQRAGATAMQLLNIVACGGVGVLAWAMAFSPATWIHHPLSSDATFWAFVVGGVGMLHAGKASRAMAGEPDED